MAEGKTEINIFSSKNNDELDDRKANVTSKLQKRDEQRIEDLQKRKEEKENAEAQNEKSDFFLENFNKSKLELESCLQKSDSLERSVLSDHFDGIISQLVQMQKFVSDSAMFLVPYEIQKAQAELNRLHASTTEKREKLLPKKKFAFKSKKKVDKTAKPVTEESSTVDKEIKVDITDCSFADMSNQTLQKTSEDLNGKDVAVARLTECEVFLKGSPGTLHMDNLKKCNVFCGPVSSSIFIDGCKDCTFIVGCQQLRIHSTVDCNFYIHVTSKAIIEDCQKVYFAPYNWTYDNIDEHYAYSGLDKGRNNWDDIDDFNWLANDQKSPHWDILPIEKRIQEWN